MVKAKQVYKAPKRSWKKDFQRNWTVYLMFLPVFIMTLVLHYIPMFGIVMAFEDYEVRKGFFGSRWVGMQNFVDLFTGRLPPGSAQYRMYCTD